MQRAARLSVWWMLGAAACSAPVEDSSSEPFAFEDLSDTEKSAYMASDVLPEMAEIFQAYDPDAYADFSCASCHVAGSADGTYAMPDAGLPPLEEDAFPYESDVGVFMDDEVLPAMADLLGGGGKPCITCHTLEH